MKSKEHLAMDYIFFRNPSYYIITLFPVVGGIIALFFVTDPLQKSTGSNLSASQALEHAMLDNYLQATAITLSFVISYFVIFKWVLMKTDGTYGFWLTQGISRTKYYFYTIIKLVGVVLVGYLIGFLFITQLAGIAMSTSEEILFVLLMISNILSIFSLAIVLSELITDPELAAIIFLTISGFNLFFNTNYNSIFHKILLSDRHYDSNAGWGVLVLSLIYSGLMFFAGFRVHIKRSIDL